MYHLTDVEQFERTILFIWDFKLSRHLQIHIDGISILVFKGR